MCLVNVVLRVSGDISRRGSLTSKSHIDVASKATLRSMFGFTDCHISAFHKVNPVLAGLEVEKGRFTLLFTVCIHAATAT